MNIQPIVEGYGEVVAVPALLRRLRDEASAWEVNVGKAIRRHRTQLIKEATLKQAVRLASIQPNCKGILIMLDCDRDCPVGLASTIKQWALEEVENIPCEVVLPKEEFESWFLASIESLRGKHGIVESAELHPNPELPRDAKSALEERMQAGRSYMERTDQPAFTELFDFALAYKNSRSFRRLVSAFEKLTTDMRIQNKISLPLPTWN